MKALVLSPAEAKVTLRDIPRPVPGAGEVLIRVHAVALNPIDEMYVSVPIAVQDQRVIGTDFAGVVVGAGPGLADSSDPRTKEGARVAGFLQGACSVNDRPGAFAEFVATSYDLLWEVPSSLSLEAASTISMCGLTAAQGLFARLKLPSPLTSSPVALRGGGPVNVLVYGSSTSLGLYIAQLAHLISQTSGQEVRLIGVASAGHHNLLRQAPYKYDVVVDYRDPSWPEKVREATGGKGVDFALDTISEGETVEKVHSTLGQEGKFHLFRGPGGGNYDTSKLRVQPIYGGVWEGLGVEIGYGNGVVFPANAESRAFAAKFFDLLSSQAATGRAVLEPNPVRSMPGGFERIVPDGLALLSGLVSKRTALKRSEEYMRPISGEKLVYTV